MCSSCKSLDQSEAAHGHRCDDDCRIGCDLCAAQFCGNEIKLNKIQDKHEDGFLMACTKCFLEDIESQELRMAV